MLIDAESPQYQTWACLSLSSKLVLLSRTAKGEEQAGREDNA